MERLTYRHEDQHGNPTSHISPDPKFVYGPREEWREKVAARLADYEDTGLEPWEIERIQDAYGRGLSLRTESAERLQMIREIPTDRLKDLVHEEAWTNACIYDLYRLLLAIDDGIKKKDLTILRPPSRPGAPENGIPFRKKLSQLEDEYDELLRQACSAAERKMKANCKKEG